MPPKGLHRFTREIQITVDHDRSFSSDDANALWNHDGEEERGSDVTCLAHPRKNILANPLGRTPVIQSVGRRQKFSLRPVPTIAERDAAANANRAGIMAAALIRERGSPKIELAR